MRDYRFHSLLVFASSLLGVGCGAAGVSASASASDQDVGTAGGSSADGSEAATDVGPDLDLPGPCFDPSFALGLAELIGVGQDCLVGVVTDQDGVPARYGLVCDLENVPFVAPGWGRDQTDCCAELGEFSWDETGMWLGQWLYQSGDWRDVALVAPEFGTVVAELSQPLYEPSSQLTTLARWPFPPVQAGCEYELLADFELRSIEGDVLPQNHFEGLDITVPVLAIVSDAAERNGHRVSQKLVVVLDDQFWSGAGSGPTPRLLALIRVDQLPPG